MIDRLDRLRHDAVIGRDHQHHDVGDLGAARPHRGERGVAGGVDEGDLLAAFRRGDLIGADMLGDAAGLAGHHIGMAQRVEQRGLAVIDVAHHGHHGRTRLGVGGIVDDVEQAFLDVGGGDPLDGVAEFLGDQLRGVGIDHVGDLVHRALLHQQADDVDRALGHAVGEFLDVDGFRDDDFADQLFLGLVGLMALQALGAAAERGDRALAHVVGIQRGNQRQAAALFGGRGLGGGLRSRDRTGDAAGAATDLARTFVLVGDVGGDTGRACGRRRSGLGRGGRGLGLGFTKATLGLEFGLALGFLFLAVALFLGLAAGFGGFALGLLDTFLGVAALGFLFGEAPFLHVADLGVGQGAGARGTLVLSQGAQHHAAAARRCRRGGAGKRRRFRGRGLGNHRLRRMRRIAARPVATDTALAALFDHHLLGAAVAEALAHGARLDAWLERQGLGRNTQCLVARRFRINHTAVLILLCRACPHSLFRRIQILGRVGGLVVIRHPVSDQDMAARQERFARRAREHGSMYHI